MKESLKATCWRKNMGFNKGYGLGKVRWRPATRKVYLLLRFETHAEYGLMDVRVMEAYDHRHHAEAHKKTLQEEVLALKNRGVIEDYYIQYAVVEKGIK